MSGSTGALPGGAADPAQAALALYFDFISIYGYFASLRIEALAARHGRAVEWHVMLLGVSVMKIMGLKPLLETPLKGDYVKRDVARYIRQHGLDVKRSLDDPLMDPRTLARAFCWVKRHYPGREGAFAAVAYDAYWRLARELVAPADVAALGPAIGLDTHVLLAGIESDESRADLRASVESALARGVFGSPTVIVQGEPFWGVDKFDQIDAWLARGTW